MKDADDPGSPPPPWSPCLDAGAGASPPSAGPVEVCAGCRQPMTRRGPKGECLRCLAGFMFLAEREEALLLTIADPEPAASGGYVRRRRYGHFEVELDTDGLPWELGAGAMATTYRARDTVLHAPVALKVIGPSLATHPAARARFLREARAAARLHHPNVAGVIHYGEQAGECFYVMELVEGETLEARVRREGALPVALALEIGLQVARALAAAQACGLLHRDLKPSNVMLTTAQGEERTDGNGGNGAPVVVKVIDWGLAKAVSAEEALAADLTQGGFVGTPAFASPEQFAPATASRPLDARSDIYSLGVMLWYLLSGRVPFAGGSLEEIHAQQTEQALPTTHLTAARVPGHVVALLRSMLAIDPAARPQSARELIESLRACQERFPWKTAAASQQTRRRRRRHRMVLALVALILAVGAAAGWQHWRRTFVPPQDRSVAVLPFENLGGDQDKAFFADGVQEEIRTDLARVADLKVIARDSTAQYKAGAPRDLRAIGADLGVAYVLEGSVQRAGGQVRVRAQLIDTRTARQQWAESYLKPLGDVFAIQSEVALAVSRQLRAQLTTQERSAVTAPPTGDLDAYDLYLQARELYERNGSNMQASGRLVEAVSLLKQALARDPNFLLAWCLIVRVQVNLYIGADHSPGRLEQISAAVQTAVRLAPDAGETHLTLAYYHYLRRDYLSAEAELALAKRTLPNDSQVLALNGYIVRRQGHWEESTRDLEQTLALSPRNLRLLQQLGYCYLYRRRYADYERVLQRILVLQPGDPSTRLYLSEVPLYMRGDIRPRQSTLAALLAENPGLASELDLPEDALCEHSPAAYARALAHLPPQGSSVQGDVMLPHAYWEGVFARVQGDSARAQAAFTAAREEFAKIVVARPDASAAFSYLGIVDAGLGRKQDAIAEGRRACELMPTSKNAVDGPVLAANLAQIYAWTGDIPAAVKQLTALERLPNYLSYGQLKLDPAWDDLRGDPGFEALLASLAPKP